MNRAEVMEIKKQFTPDRLCIVRAAGCYIGAEKGKAWSFSSPFYKLPDEEKHKYLAMYGKTLSGKTGDALLDVPLADNEEHSFLEKLLKSELQDEALNGILYDLIMRAYDSTNYYITAVCIKYDVPVKGTDKLKQGESDEVYSAILVSVSPAKLSQPGLTYAADDAGEERVRLRIRDWVIGNPDAGFLYPEFNERSSDHDKALYFSPKAGAHPAFPETMFGKKPPERVETQKKTLAETVKAATEGDPEQAEKIDKIYDILEEKAEEKEDGREPLLGKSEIADALKKAGVDAESVSAFEEKVPEELAIRKEAIVRPEPQAEAAKKGLLEEREELPDDAERPIQIISRKAIRIKFEEINGEKYFLIPAVSDVTLNGVLYKL